MSMSCKLTTGNMKLKIWYHITCCYENVYVKGHIQYQLSLTFTVHSRKHLNIIHLLFQRLSSAGREDFIVCFSSPPSPSRDDYVCNKASLCAKQFMSQCPLVDMISKQACEAKKVRMWVDWEGSSC